MPTKTDLKIPSSAQPRPDDYAFDLDRALEAMVAVHAVVPEDAFTAETLGTERAGNGVLIDDGLVLTIGYLVTEASEVWLTLAGGRTVPGHVLGYDQESGFGLVQALDRVDVPPLPIGDSSALPVGSNAVFGAAGGRRNSMAVRVLSKQEFAGYWEYLLDEAIFTAPAHPHWGGGALIGAEGELVGIGSLQFEHEAGPGKSLPLNMVVPIDLLKPILADLKTIGRPNRPARPWLGVYATEDDDQVMLVGIAPKGPGEIAGLRAGDVVLSVAGAPVEDLAGFYRALWALGTAGVEVPLELLRSGRTVDLSVVSGERSRFLKRPRLH